MAANGVAQAAFAETKAVIWRSVEIADPEIDRSIDRFAGSSIRNLAIKISERSRAEAESGNADTGPAERSCGQSAAHCSSRLKVRVIGTHFAPSAAFGSGRWKRHISSSQRSTSGGVATRRG